MLYSQAMADKRRISKTLSYWLRHDPEAGGLTLDEAGWSTVEPVMAALARKGLTDRLEDLISHRRRERQESTSSFPRIGPASARGRAIRWRSISNGRSRRRLSFCSTERVDRFIDAIVAEGLKPMKRHHVHLSPNAATATAVGARRGKPVILEIAAGEMHRSGETFRLSGNGVWLVGHVPPAFIRGRARRQPQAAMKIEPTAPRCRFPPPFVYLGFLLIGLGAERWTDLSSFGIDRLVAFGLGALLFSPAGGEPGRVASVRARRNTGRAMAGVDQDRGIGAGIRWTRNPMYLGMALIYAGLAIALDGPIALILLPVVLAIIQTQVIAREERYLEGKFGKAYRDYKARVRRWM